MEWWQAVILGLVEGITEYLPVSSSGHLILASALLGLDTLERRGALAAFEIAIQAGAIAAVLALYPDRVRLAARGLAGDLAGRRLLVNLAAAFVPAAVLGLLLDETIERHLFQPLPVLAALVVGGVWMIRLGQRGADSPDAPPGTDGRRGLDELDWRTAFGIGLFQCAALWPGTSRSMMTIAGGIVLGLRARDAAEFSFLLGVPTLGAACAYKVAMNLLDAANGGEPHLFDTLGFTPVFLGFAVATVSAAFAVRWLVAFLGRAGLAPFGWYRLALALALGGLYAAGVIRLGH